jgi:hypothetical protein
MKIGSGPDNLFQPANFPHRLKFLKISGHRSINSRVPQH